MHERNSIMNFKKNENEYVSQDWERTKIFHGSYPTHGD
jgi:hypothetical protein